MSVLWAVSLQRHITQIQEPEYDAILRQVVAVIDRTRVMAADFCTKNIGDICVVRKTPYFCSVKYSNVRICVEYNY
mgnify:CR=1 FL=1